MAQITFFHCPGSRSSATLFLLEELGVPYDVRLTDVRAGAGQTPEYLAVNPMGKVPAIVDDGEAVAETGAIALYLADKYADAGLAPPIGDPRRGAYLRWLFFSSSMDTVLVERMFGREPMAAAAAGYGDYDRVMRALRLGLEPGPWLLGDQFTAADVIVGAGVPWAFANGTIPKDEPFKRYAARIEARPAYQRARAKDAG